MKIIIRIIFISLLSTEFIFGQQLNEKKKYESILFIGFKAGPSFSKFVVGSHDYVELAGGTDNYQVTYEKKYKAGFNAGCFAEMQYSKHFSFRFEYNYFYFSQHDISYIDNESGAAATEYYANYSFNSSISQFSALPKFIIGKQSKIYLLIGPYLDFSYVASHVRGHVERVVQYYPGHPASDTLYTNIKPQLNNNALGFIFGAGINIPVKDNYFCIEIRLAPSISNILINPNIREIIPTLNIIYQFKIKSKPETI